MQKRDEIDDIYAERESLRIRVTALETDISAAQARLVSLQAELARKNDEHLTSLNDLVALGNLLRNEEQKCKKLAIDRRIAKKGVHARELKLRDSYAEIALLREALEKEAQEKSDLCSEKRKSDKKLIALRVQHEAIRRKNAESGQRQKSSKVLLDRHQANIAAVSRILQEMAKHHIMFPSPATQSGFSAIINGSSSPRWQKFRCSLAEEGIFDSESYLAVNPDVAGSDIDPLVHFLTHGLAEHRKLKKDARL